MKIAPPITHQLTQLTPTVLPQGRITVPPSRPAEVEGDETAQALTEKDGNLARQGQTNLLRDQATIFTGLKSQARQLQDRSLQMIARYAKGVNSDARALRRQLKGRPLQNTRATLLEILESGDDKEGMVHSLLLEAARQARNEGDNSEYLFFKRELKWLWKERGQSPRSTVSRAPNRRQLSTNAPYRAGLETIYSAAVSAPLNVLGLVDALLGEMRVHGQFETSLREMRSDMAAHLALAATSNAMSQTGSLMGGLTTASHVAALLSECEHLLGRMRPKNPELKIESIALLRHLLTLIGTLMEPEQTRTLVELIGGKHLRNQLACLNELKRILNQRLPVQLLRTKKGFINLRDNLLILSTVLTNEEQKLAQENNGPWNA